jgi:hypothetical protein
MVWATQGVAAAMNRYNAEPKDKEKDKDKDKGGKGPQTNG